MFALEHRPHAKIRVDSVCRQSAVRTMMRPPTDTSRWWCSLKTENTPSTTTWMLFIHIGNARHITAPSQPPVLGALILLQFSPAEGAKGIPQNKLQITAEVWEPSYSMYFLHRSLLLSVRGVLTWTFTKFNGWP